MKDLTKTVWIYWHQGWEQAPNVVKKCLSTWISLNPSWNVENISQYNLSNFIDLEREIPEIGTKEITLASKSDIIRIALLWKYGGIWVDSTLFCRIPLDNWVGRYSDYDFFAFSKPGGDRMVASWFLGARKNSYIVRAWYHRTIDYWKQRVSTDTYFWFHHQFNELYKSDRIIRQLWDDTPEILAEGPHYFLPYNTRLFEIATSEKIKSIESVQSPVFKLTYKYDPDRERKGTVLDYLLYADLKTTI